MDHRGFLKTLDPAVKAGLSLRSTRAGLCHLALHLGLILLSALCVELAPWPLALPAMLALGICLTFLFTLEHEATHRTPFGHDGLNDWVGLLCGLVLILPFTWFRHFHLAHHRWTNIPGQDPELAGEKPATRAAWAWHVSGLPYWASQVRLMGQLVLGRGMADFVPAKARGRVVAEARMMAAAYGLVALSLVWSPVALWFWIVPMVLGQPFLRLYLLAEHGDCPRVADMFLNTRTTFTTGLVRLLAWNMPYHVEHHVMPQVPFHRLPKVHGLMKAELRVTAAGYSAFTRGYLARRR
jgi:fatty acid desaturase